MPRVANYDEKIQQLQEKIDKKKEEIKALKEKQAEWQEKKNKADNQALMQYMEENDLSAEDVLAALQQ